MAKTGGVYQTILGDIFLPPHAFSIFCHDKGALTLVAYCTGISRCMFGTFLMQKHLDEFTIFFRLLIKTDSQTLLIYDKNTSHSSIRPNAGIHSFEIAKHSTKELTSWEWFIDI